MTVVFLCCAAGGDAGVEPRDPRLLEAQAAFDEAVKLDAAGKYAEAITKAEQALTLKEAVLGGTHLDVAECLSALGEIYRRQGEHVRSERVSQRALAIREQALGKQHPLVAESLKILAISYDAQGLYDRAEPLFERALAINEAALGKQDPQVANVLNNLGLLYSKQGLYSRAEPLLERALAIWEASLGKQHPRVATALNNLGLVYSNQRLYSQAESSFERALAIWEASLGKQHPNCATALNNLGRIYEEQGLYSRAAPLLERALAIREATLGKQHPNTASALLSLASLYKSQGLYDRAAPLLERALAIQEAALARQHPLVATTLNNFARLRLGQHRLTDALPLLTRAFSISEHRLRQEALGFSESRLASFLQLLRADEEYLYSLARAYPRNAAVQRLALSAVLLLKGRSVEEVSNTSRTILLSLGPQDRDTFERLRALRTQLASLSLQGPGALSPADYQKSLKELADQGDALEADLARHSAPLRALSALPSSEDIAGRVAASLPKDGALIEFVAYLDRPLVPKPGTPESKLPSELRYLALVLFPDARISTVDLGPAAPIDRAVSTLRDALALRDAAYQPQSRALYSLIFKPLRPLLGGTRRLFLAPDGQLALVPFAALHDGKAFLIDTFELSYLTSGKELLPRTEEGPSSGAVVVLADPAFTTAPLTPATPEPTASQRSASLERFFSTLRADISGHSWPSLPGTRREAEAIQRLLPQAQLFLGPEASKQRLLELRTPAVLHIATHGFFLEDAAAPPADSRALGSTGDSAATSQRPADPLLRSGLVLTGASSQAPQASAATARPDASLVTALELAGLDLWGTQLVVLSACDTGRGDVKLGQGVYGLRRALVVAGAQTVVMSLWKVNDDSTRLLMEHFYQNLLAGQGRSSALQNAMRSVRESQPHPYSWAPFISLGSDAPLRSPTPKPQQAPAP